MTPCLVCGSVQLPCKPEENAKSLWIPDSAHDYFPIIIKDSSIDWFPIDFSKSILNVKNNQTFDKISL